ncbi:hypothetical protein LLE49_22200 [Alicyclobacillus tolerans]|uniref:hypothetical protein n=1 Tax=Alicyclobacillus tolerans TaxID=90970 RepID=UPI001F286533|nr:hypothetical protein [Alicyclobacillus tolerans]MCF8567434.1 hypothetical protein [Alicyclobacillus tolerans]
MEEFWTKVDLLWPWLLALFSGFVLGVPLTYAVSVGDTALSQGTELAKTGSSATTVQTAMTTIMESGLPTQTNGVVLFNPGSDISVTPNATGTTETVRLTYHDPMFAPFVHLFGFTGPTFPMTFTKTVSVASANEEGVNYIQ